MNHLCQTVSLLIQVLYLTKSLDISCNPKSCLDIENFGADQSSLFMIDAKGRLGNHLMAYALVKALAFDHNILPLVTRETRDYLEAIFDYENDVKVFEDAFCDIDKALARITVFEDTIDSLVSEKDNFKGKFFNLWPKADFFL